MPWLSRFLPAEVTRMKKGTWCLLLVLILSAALPAEDQELLKDLLARREKVLEALGKDVLLLRSRQPARLSNDIHYEFREENNLYYLTGLEQPGTFLLMSGRSLGDAGNVALFTRTAATGRVSSVSNRRPTRSEVSARTGLPARAVLDPAGLERILRKALGVRGKNRAPSATRLLYYNHRVTASDRAHDLVARLRKSRAGRRKIKSPGILFNPLRRIKSPYEIKCMRKAVKATEAGLLAAIREMRPGMHEYEVEATIEYHYRRLGCEGMAFPSIVGSGPNSCILHYNLNRRKMKAGDILVMDVGGDHSHYAADITRTVPVSGTFTPRQRALYDLVLAAQLAGIAAVKPGRPFSEPDRVARKIIGEGLKKLGLIKSASQCRKYFMHGTSHTLGMDAHDVPARTLEPGMVITVEPGIYIAEAELGIRIEDDVLVTENGAEVLSSGVPKDPGEIEALMAGGK